MVPAKKMEKDMTNEELIQPPLGYPSLLVGLKYKEFEIATVKILGGDHGTRVPMYFRITSSIKESDAVAFRTYHKVEGPYCDYLRQQYAKPLLLTGPVLTKTPETKLDEKWTKCLCNFEQGTVVYVHLGVKIYYKRTSFKSCFWDSSYVGSHFWWL